MHPEDAQLGRHASGPYPYSYPYPNGAAGYPLGYMIRGMTIALAPTPGTENYTLAYLAGITHLGTDAVTPNEDTNWLLVQWPNYLYYGALRHSAPWLGQDARIATWESFFQPTARAMKKSAFRMKTGGGPIRMRPDTFA